MTKLPEKILSTVGTLEPRVLSVVLRRRSTISPAPERSDLSVRRCAHWVYGDVARSFRVIGLVCVSLHLGWNFCDRVTGPGLLKVNRTSETGLRSRRIRVNEKYSGWTWRTRMKEVRSGSPVP